MAEKITFRGITYNSLYGLIEDYPNFDNLVEEKIIIETNMKSLGTTINSLVKKRIKKMLEELK